MQIRNPQYLDDGMILCEINHPVYGWMSHNASSDDPETQQIYARITNGEAGPVAPVMPPPPAKETLPATWTHIKRWRDTHEVSVIQTSLGLFDCDSLSEQRMVDSIEQFDVLPTLNSDGTLTWKRGDNSYRALSKAELQQVFKEIKTGRAVRSARLHVRAVEFDAQGTKPTITQLQDISFWLPHN